MDKELLTVLAAREQRWEMRKKLVRERGSCLITVTICAPVAYRTSDEFWVLFVEICNAFCKILTLNGYEWNSEGYIRNEDGPAFFISTNSDAFEIKRICIEAEETIPGARMLDIDVMDRHGTPVSRSDVGSPPRKCFICDKPAHFCVSRKTHTQDEIYAYVEKLKRQLESKSV